MILISFSTSSTDGPRCRSRPALGTSSARLQRALALPMICLGLVRCVEREGICKLSGAYKVVRCPPTGRLKGPLEPNGCGAAGNFTDGFTPPEMFLAAATATAPGIGGGHSLANSAFDCYGKTTQCRLRHLAPCIRKRTGPPGRSDVLFRGFAANLIPIVFLTTVCYIW